jgi:hypothetical protein
MVVATIVSTAPPSTAGMSLFIMGVFTKTARPETRLLQGRTG